KTLHLTEGALAPLDVAQLVIDTAFGVALAAHAQHCNDIRICTERLFREFDPAFDDLAVAVDELYELDLRPKLAQADETSIARPSGGERPRHVQLDHFRDQRARECDTAIIRIGIDVHKCSDTVGERTQAGFESF